METNTRNKTWIMLWIITAVFALALLAATGGLALKAHSNTDPTMIVYLVGRSKLIYLRDQPLRTGRITAVLDSGVTATVTDVAEQNDQPWYFVETESNTGWIQAQNISLSPP